MPVSLAKTKANESFHLYLHGKQQGGTVVAIELALRASRQKGL